MLYIFHGADTHKARTALHRVVDGLLAKKPDASYFLLNDETFSPALLEEYIGGQGLFAERTIVVLDNVFMLKEAGDTVLGRTQDIADSNNIFIILEGALPKKELATLTKHAHKTELFELEQMAGRGAGTFNVFSLTDALGNRDKGMLWTLYRRAIRSGVEPEQIHGILAWQVRTMVRVMHDDIEGLKPFVVTKAKRFAKQYSEKEVKELSLHFLCLYHNAHRGIVDFELEMERLILTMA